MRRQALMFATLIVAGTLVTRAGHAQTCKKPRVLVVLDKSSSMITGTVAGKTKWDVAKAALAGVLSTYEGNVDFGLMLFPNPNECGPGAVKVPIGPGRAGAIMNELAAPPPDGGNWTPMAQSLDEAAKYPALLDASYANHVLLITDGWQWCSPYDASTRFLPVNAVNNLKALSIKTWVVGFGEGVDALTLNKMADAALTRISPTCNAASDNLAAANNCYYQANDPGQLNTALQTIASQISNEVCDGADNDCDGLIDEELAGPACANQIGVCAGATQTCGGAAGWSCAAADYERRAASQGSRYAVDEETCGAACCDGKDNDCDNVIDEGCSCTNGQTRPCGKNAGVCRQGTQTCVNGKWSACAGEIRENYEVCDGEDNDCDGPADEELTRDCGNACGPGQETCQSGAWVQCTAPQPSQEICDGLDNDCDNVVDGPSAICESGGVCVNGTCQAADGGCDCELGHQRTALPLPLLGLPLLGLLLVLRRRR